MQNTNKGVILIIEDQENFRRIYRDVLENDGYEVLEALDGEKGLELIKSEKPKLVLLDLVLPKIDGFEILKKVRADSEVKDIPILILSVLGEKKDISRGLALGANDYTVKGFYSPRDILQKIQGLLTKADIKGNIGSYSVFIKEGRGDEAKLRHDIGITGSFECPDCKGNMALNLIPDYTRKEGHWFSAHFVCTECERPF